jgi:hypothetical protein
VRHYRRNPGVGRGLFGGFQRQFMGGLFALGGGAVTRLGSGLVPLSDDGVTGVAKTALVAGLVGWASRRFLSGETAAAVGYGAAEAAWRKLAITFMGDTAAKWLGEYDMLGGYQQMGSGLAGYLQPGTMYENSGLGSYQQLTHQ